MLWDSETAVHYDQWVESPQGSFALKQQKRLLLSLIAHWPRRRQKLLDLGCGTGMFLDFFWSCGFDLTGLDSSPAMLARARTKMGSRVDLHLGQAEHLPFDDKEFDYCALMTVLEFTHDPAQVLKEVLRVTRKGILIMFLNRTSLYRFVVRRAHKDSALSRARWFSWLEMRALINQSVRPGALQAQSILLGPPPTWSHAPVVRHLNSLLLPPWLGSVTAVCADLGPVVAQTPLMAWETEPTG